MNNKKIKQIPYGLANYELLVEQNCYYVDKTVFLPTVEKGGNYLFFIRPRRFGKSLFLAVMQAYYDVYYKDRFEDFFKGLWIYDHPTGERGKYLVLNLIFSVVEPDPGKMEASFLNHIQNNAVDFVYRYGDYLSAYRKMDYLSKKIENSQSATDILSSLLLLCKGASQKLYVIIDEYDNFANTILSTVGQDTYRKLTHGPGFFRSFFNALKEGTTGTGAPITRSFITGVSPITMDDVTSGGRMKESMSLRDLITGEKSIQAFLNVYLGLSDLYIVHPEKEMNKGYADIVPDPFLARYEGIKYSYLLEIKYIKPKEARKSGNDEVKKLKAEAEAQLKNYSLDEKFKKNIENTTLIKIILIFSGHELMHISKV